MKVLAGLGGHDFEVERTEHHKKRQREGNLPNESQQNDRIDLQVKKVLN